MQGVRYSMVRQVSTQIPCIDWCVILWFVKCQHCVDVSIDVSVLIVECSHNSPANEYQ